MGEPAPPVTLGRRPKPREGRPSAPRPTVSRRREVSHASARSLLMTVLGEYALPRDTPVWTSMLVEELGLDAQAMSFTATYGEVGEQETMVARSWDLTELKDRYEDFIDRFTGLHPSGGRAVLRAQTELVHEWRRFPFLDPQLPAELLPAKWSGTKAAELFHHKHVDWRPEAQ